MLENWNIRHEIRGNEINFTIYWSPWGSMDRWVINRLVPSEAGLFQLWVKEGRGLVLALTEQTYYGGLRNTLREVIDEMAPAGKRFRDIIDGRECWFRFSTLSVKEQLQSLKKWFDESEVNKECFDEEGREIFVQEIEMNRKFPLPPPDIKIAGRGKMKDSEYGPPMPSPGK